jgi:hypothetical protein
MYIYIFVILITCENLKNHPYLMHLCVIGVDGTYVVDIINVDKMFERLM